MSASDFDWDAVDQSRALDTLRDLALMRLTNKLSTLERAIERATNQK